MDEFTAVGEWIKKLPGWNIGWYYDELYQGERTVVWCATRETDAKTVMADSLAGVIAEAIQVESMGDIQKNNADLDALFGAALAMTEEAINDGPDNA